MQRLWLLAWRAVSGFPLKYSAGFAAVMSVRRSE
jgi:hypothetical protein